METKMCSKCKLPKSLDEFGKNSKSKDGLLGYCKTCRNKIENSNAYKERKKKWYNINRDKMLAYAEQYRKNNVKLYDKEKRREEYAKNKDKETEKKKKWYINNISKVKEYTKEYRKNNPIDKTKRNLKRQEKFKTDQLYKLKHDIRGLIWSAFKDKGYGKNGRTEKILGCTFKEFLTHIESKFEPWMNWENHGKYTGNMNEHWHLDHKIPLSSAKTIEDVIKLNHYTNFQPLDSYVNQILKRDKINWI